MESFKRLAATRQRQSTATLCTVVMRVTTRVGTLRSNSLTTEHALNVLCKSQRSQPWFLVEGGAEYMSGRRPGGVHAHPRDIAGPREPASCHPGKHPNDVLHTQMCSQHSGVNKVSKYEGGIHPFTCDGPPTEAGPRGSHTLDSLLHRRAGRLLQDTGQAAESQQKADRVRFLIF